VKSKRPPEARYRAPADVSQAELREKGSRFLAFVLPESAETDVGSLLAEYRGRFPDATHHCWAYRFGWPPRERSSDAGEPAGTAGRPILRVLQGREVSDTLVLVARWFGGTRLGKGGLARAYTAAAKAALDRARWLDRFPTVELVVEVPYDRVGAVKHLVNPPEIELVSEEYGRSARIVLRVAAARQREFENALGDRGVGAREALGVRREQRE
jgi:uncharacterized YigZ family protein